MSLRKRASLMAAAATLMLCGHSMARGEVPGGPPLPAPGGKVTSASGFASVAYQFVSRVYKYQGEYSLTYNFVKVGPAMLYGFADVDVEAAADQSSHFRPDRLTGTFELGLHGVGAAPLSFYLGHRSPHNIDRNDRKQGSWETVGARWNRTYGRTDLTLGVGHYIHNVVSDYQWDFVGQAVYHLPRMLGRTWSVRGALHHVEESSRSGFTDYWLEPSTNIQTHLSIFLGAGQVHYIDVFAGRTDQVAEAGMRVSW